MSIMNDQGCAEVISQLISNGSLCDIIPTLGSDEFNTFDHLLSLAEDYHSFSGGRVTSQELQAYLNVDMHYVDKIIQKMISQCVGGDKNLHFLGGELISQDYLDSLVIEISQLLRRHQRQYIAGLDSQSPPVVSIGTLVTRFRLPLDIMTSVVKAHFPNEKCFFSSSLATSSSRENDKKGHKKKKKVENAYTSSLPVAENQLAPSTVNAGQHQAAKAVVYGMCLGSLLPLPLTSILQAVESMGHTEATILSILQDLTTAPKSGACGVSNTVTYWLPGVCNNKEYIPYIFMNQRRLQADDYFRSNNLISFSYLQSLHIHSKQLDFMTSSFQDAIALDSCIISASLGEVFLSSIAEVTAAFPFPTGGAASGGNASMSPPWLSLASALPSGLTDLDTESLLKSCGANVNSKSCGVSVMTAPSDRSESYLLNNQFLSFLRGVVSSAASSTATADSMSVSALKESSSHSRSSASSKGVTSISMTSTSSAKQAPAVTSAKTTRIDLYDEDDEGVGRGKKGKTKKAGKSGKHAVQDEEPEALTSKSSKKGGKRGKNKDKDIESTKASFSAEQSHHGTASARDKDADMIDSLIAPFVTKQRLIELFLTSCPVTLPEVEDALSALNASGDDTDFDDVDSVGTVLPLFEAIFSQLQSSAVNEYTKAAQHAIFCTTQGTHDTRMKRELSRDQKFEEYWTNLQVSSKVLLSLEKDCTPETPLYDHLSHVHSFLLATKCAPMARMLTEFCCWEHDAECPSLQEGSSLSFEQRRQLQKDLPQDTGNLLLKLWKTLGSHDQGSQDATATVWGFMDVVSSPIFKDTFNLIVHKLDKKKEKNLSFTFKQQVMDALKTETDIQKMCCLVLSLATYQLTNSVLDLPSNVMTSTRTPEKGSDDAGDFSSSPSSSLIVSFLLAWLRPPRVRTEDHDAIAALVQVACASSSSTVALDEVTRIIEAAKLAVQGLKKAPQPSS